MAKNHRYTGPVHLGVQGNRDPRDGNESKRKSNKNEVDVVAAYNAVNDPDLGTDVGWTPTLVLNLEDTRDFWPMVQAHAGPFDLQDK